MLYDIMTKDDNMKTKKNKVKSEILELVQTAIIAFILVFITTSFFFKPVRVYGSSMYPTLHDGDTGLSNIIGVKISGIERFDIVVVKLEYNGEHLVKRVIGLPNEKLCYDNDRLYINDEYIAEDFLQPNVTNNRNFTSNIKCFVLASDEYFLMGDNRPNSTDSRHYGTFDQSQIISKGVFVLWPFKDFGGY